MLDSHLITERLESLKAGIVGGFSVGVAFLLTSAINTLGLGKYFSTLVILQVDFNLSWLCNGVIAGISGLLFGVTYRYIIRTDDNPQLKTGAVMSFGLVRGLTQLEMGWNNNSPILPLIILGSESIFWFAAAAIAIDIAIKIGWVKFFPSTSSTIKSIP